MITIKRRIPKPTFVGPLVHTTDGYYFMIMQSAETPIQLSYDDYTQAKEARGTLLKSANMHAVQSTKLLQAIREAILENSHQSHNDVQEPPEDIL